VNKVTACGYQNSLVIFRFAIAQGKYLIRLLQNIKNYQKNQDDIYV
jgi:hypothetical protein